MTVRREESSREVGATQAPAMQLVRVGVGFGLRTLGMLPVLVLVCIVFQLLNGRFSSLQNVSIIAQQASINVVLAAILRLPR